MDLIQAYCISKPDTGNSEYYLSLKQGFYGCNMLLLGTRNETCFHGYANKGILLTSSIYDVLTNKYYQCILSK